MIKVVRATGWEERLRRLLESARAKSFEWGVHDCCTFAIADVEALAGGRFIGAFPEWKSEDEARAMLAERSLADRISDVLGPTNYGWKFARRGDIGLIESVRLPGDEVALGICVGAYAAVPGVSRLEFVSFTQMTKVWRVG